MRRALTIFDNSVARCRGRRPLGAGVELLAAALLLEVVACCVEQKNRFQIRKS